MKLRIVSIDSDLSTNERHRDKTIVKTEHNIKGTETHLKI